MSGAVSGTITQEGGLLLLSFGVGILLMLSYDILRIFRQVAPHGPILLGVEDVIYWLFCALLIFAMLYQENDGLLRWFVLAGIALGMLAENHFISPHVVKMISFIIKKVVWIFSKPFRATAKRGKKIAVFFQKQLKKIEKAIKIGIRKL